MSRLLFLLILCVALALFRVVAFVVAALIVLMVLVAFITRPRESIVFLTTLTLSSLAVAKPLACIIALAIFSVAVVVTGRNRRFLRAEVREK